MALTDRKKNLVVEMLGIPAGSYLWKTDQFGLNSMRFASQTELSAQQAVYALLADLDAAQETLVEELVDEYDSIRIASAGVRVQNGNVGGNDLTGTDVDFTHRKTDLKEMLKVYVPFYQSFETMATRNQQTALAMAAVRM